MAEVQYVHVPFHIICTFQKGERLLTMTSREQLEAVARVQGSNSFSAALGVSQDAKLHELRKAYRRLALLLHPDKNKAPGAGKVYCFNVLSFNLTTIGEAFKTVTTAYEALTVKDGGEGSLREEVSVNSFKKFFNGQAKAGGAVLEAESDEEVDLPDLMPVNSPVSSASSSKTNSSSIYYGPAPPMASKTVVLEYNELGMPRISYRDISPERQEGRGCLKRGVPTYKPRVVGRL